MDSCKLFLDGKFLPVLWINAENCRPVGIQVKHDSVIFYRLFQYVIIAVAAFIFRHAQAGQVFRCIIDCAVKGVIFAVSTPKEPLVRSCIYLDQIAGRIAAVSRAMHFILFLYVVFFGRFDSGGCQNPVNRLVGIMDSIIIIQCLKKEMEIDSGKVGFVNVNDFFSDISRNFVFCFHSFVSVDKCLGAKFFIFLL